MPARAEWQEEWLTFKDRLGKHHLVQFHNIIEAIHALLRNPAHANCIIYCPSKLFSSSARNNHIYSDVDWEVVAHTTVDKIDSTGLTERKCCTLIQQLFHKSGKIILEPLIKAGENSIDVTGSNGKVHHFHPVLTAYITDYP
ncbi:hypothetical protein FOMPIDRAFT_92655 [Fomitopsis schrenkii]|uniref:Uncharacterized protein n=1 Tax=Fomitopsis schrenkii TaxID=2126942 RepID=S8FCB4_FOMSC|nr:hypothetical protein FOMPIDRAFT_92655 [Fomitopsis schrenkii]